MGEPKGQGAIGSSDQQASPILDAEPLDQLHQLSQVYVSQGKFAEALALCHQIIKQQPHWGAVYQTLGSILNAQNKHTAANRAYQMAISLQPDSTRSQLFQNLQFPQGDYVSPNLAKVKIDVCFPYLTIDNVSSKWCYNRREIPHNRYVDQRFPTVGFITRDEAHILYNTALQFQGKRALEIGCWLGWSTCHLALGGVLLDVIDPQLSDPIFYQSVQFSLQKADALKRVNLISGYSPQTVKELFSQRQEKWSLMFIDGNHEAPFPLNDAIICEQLAESDALVLFHDLVSPDVFQGWDYFRQQGWQVGIYQTKQIMGVAWRGNTKPIAHISDPTVDWTLPNHIQKNWVISQLFEKPSKPGYSEQIRQLVAENPGQMSVEEYSYIAEIVRQNTPGNFLIFGLGKDSSLWMEINQGGKTVFLEDNPAWFNEVTKNNSALEAYLVNYQSKISDWKNLLVQYEQGQNNLNLKLPRIIYQTVWDWILVDAPAGYSQDTPGRMKSIYIASELAQYSKQTDVFVHDCDRTVEKVYTSYFLKDSNLVHQIQRLNHYQIKP